MGEGELKDSKNPTNIGDKRICMTKEQSETLQEQNVSQFTGKCDSIEICPTPKYTEICEVSTQLTV